ncbi:transposase [Streptomyces longwoodensis]|uniref:transposase n=1 Tax=Streptomyces longwoodensis TaxID=68231 RepID=UPI00386B012F
MVSVWARASDGQWAVLEPLLPVAVWGRPLWARRKLIDGIRWRVRTGAPRRDLPSEYGRGRRSTASSPLATRRHLARPADPAGLGGPRQADHVGGQRRLPCRAHQRAIDVRRYSQAQKESSGGAAPTPRNTAWAGVGGGSPPRSIWIASKANGH